MLLCSKLSPLGTCDIEIDVVASNRASKAIVICWHGERLFYCAAVRTCIQDKFGLWVESQRWPRLCRKKHVWTVGIYIMNDHYIQKQ
jgi:hypothetical protein